MEQQLEYEELTRDNSPLLEEIASSDSKVTLDEALRIRKEKKREDAIKRAEEKKKREEIGSKIRPDFIQLIEDCNNYKQIKGLYKHGLISKDDYKEYKSLSKKVLKGLDYQMGQYVEMNDTYAHKQADDVMTKSTALPLAGVGAITSGIFLAMGHTSVNAVVAGIFGGILGCVGGAVISIPFMFAGIPIARRIMYNNQKKHYGGLNENLELLEKKRSYIENKMNLNVDLEKVVNLSDNKADKIYKGINYVKRMGDMPGKYANIIKKYELK